jgi:hypothetical protein
MGQCLGKMMGFIMLYSTRNKSHGRTSIRRFFWQAAAEEPVLGYMEGGINISTGEKLTVRDEIDFYILSLDRQKQPPYTLFHRKQCLIKHEDTKNTKFLA